MSASDVLQATPDNSGRSQQIEQRWGDGLGGGFTVVPTVLLHHQNKLGLNPDHLVILINLVSHWWDADRMPYPRTETLARRTGLSLRTVQRRIKELEQNGFLRRIPREEDSGVMSTKYDLEPLVEKLKPLGHEAMTQRITKQQINNFAIRH